jgi:4'-phosphopantetheinyl transferase EntD
MIEEILLPGVAAMEAFEDVPGVLLFPEEEVAIARAVDERRREFATARVCARGALARLGLPPAPIVPGQRGAPQWPANVVGSITHCAGYRAAAVARAGNVITLGVDAEPDQPLPDGVLDIVASADERTRLAELTTATPGPCWDRLLFSAKESVYKAWFPLTQRWLDFGQVRITIEPAAATFTAHLLVPGPTAGRRQLNEFTGRWLARNGLILTAITMPAEP